MIVERVVRKQLTLTPTHTTTLPHNTQHRQGNWIVTMVMSKIVIDVVDVEFVCESDERSSIASYCWRGATVEPRVNLEGGRGGEESVHCTLL